MAQRQYNALDPFLLAMGQVPHASFVELVGENLDVDIGTVPETVWNAGGNYAFRTTAAVVEVVSSSIEDDPDKPGAGTGAWSVEVHGLDANFDEISETIALNGTAPVVGTKLFYRINAVHVHSFGTGKTNAGDITVRDASAGTTRGYIAANNGRSQMAVYTVPAGKTLCLDGFYFSSVITTGPSGAIFEVRETHNAIGGAEHAAWTVFVNGTFSSPFTVPHRFPEKTDIKVNVTSVTDDNSKVFFHGHAVLFGEYAI